MASSVAADTVSRSTCEFNESDDTDENYDAVLVNTESLDDGPLTSQDGGKPRPLPALAAGGSSQQDRQGQGTGLGRGRRAAVTQYLGKHRAISVVEEERTSDDDPDDDDALGGSSMGRSTTNVADVVRASHYVVDFPQSSRMRYTRTSLLGRPLGYRSSRRDSYLKRLQNRVYIFLERPKTCPAITYHTTV